MIRGSFLNKPNWIVVWVSLMGKFTLYNTVQRRIQNSGKYLR